MIVSMLKKWILLFFVGILSSCSSAYIATPMEQYNVQKTMLIHVYSHGTVLGYMPFMGCVRRMCVSLTVCSPNNLCQRIDNIMLDTGSTGLLLYQNGISKKLRKALIEHSVLHNGRRSYICKMYVGGTYFGDYTHAIIKVGNEKFPTNIAVISKHGKDTPCSNSSDNVSYLPDYTNGMLGIGPSLTKSQALKWHSAMYFTKTQKLKRLHEYSPSLSNFIQSPFREFTLIKLYVPSPPIFSTSYGNLLFSYSNRYFVPHNFSSSQRIVLDTGFPASDTCPDNIIPMENLFDKLITYDYLNKYTKAGSHYYFSN